ncbi:MAG: MipA/OmpV family protein [Rhodocyclaceae bacterium]|nr:MipA/OmpV family protein [Rhodocyclaceae bacterium]
MNTPLRIAVMLAWLPVVVGAAEDKPLWEVGVGVAALSFPAYRGSDQQHSFLMPVPYFVYHGDFLKADRHGIRGSLFDSDRVDLTLSLAASPPTDSDKVDIRDGMADLKPTAEFGPEINVTLWRSADRTRFLKLRAPLRAAFTLEASPRAIGWIFSPNLNVDIADPPALPGWNLGFVAGPIWATSKQHDYFYGVAPRYATSLRPAYQASGGYSGSQFLVSLSKRYAKTWVGAFARYDTLSGASFIDSPLVARKHFAAAGIAISWILDESKMRVRVDD